MTNSKSLTYLVLVAVIISLLFGGLVGCTEGPATTVTVTAPGTTQTATPTPKPEKVILKESSHEALTTFMNQHWWNYWAMLVNSKLEQAGYGDQYEVVNYPAQQLAAAADQYEAIRDGIADCGMIIGPYEAGTLKLLSVTDLPYLYKNMPTSYRLMHRLLDAGLQDYLHSFGVHLVSPYSCGGQTLWSKDPIRSLEDVKGLKIRDVGGATGEIERALGMTPVQLTSPEIYSALQTGVIDAVAMFEGTAISLKYDELVNYACRDHFNSVDSCGMGVNLEVWNSLPGPVQGILVMCGELASYHMFEAVNYSMLEDITKKIQDEGIEITKLAPEEKERWKEATMPVWDSWLEKNGDEYNGLGRKLWDIAKATMENPEMEKVEYFKN